MKADNCHRVGEDYPQYLNYSRALNATGRPMWFTSCEWGVDSPWEWMAPYANDWRATDDHHEYGGTPRHTAHRSTLHTTALLL